MRKLIKNSIRTPDNTVLTSKNQHDFKSHKDTKSNELYFTDGGTNYIRRSINKIPYEDLSLYSDDPFEKLRERLEWGSRGKNGDEPLQYKSISNMSTKHINAVLLNCRVSDYMKEIFEKEIEYRKECEQKGLTESHWGGRLK